MQKRLRATNLIESTFSSVEQQRLLSGVTGFHVIVLGYEHPERYQAPKPDDLTFRKRHLL